MLEKRILYLDMSDIKEIIAKEYDVNESSVELDIDRSPFGYSTIEGRVVLEKKNKSELTGEVK